MRYNFRWNSSIVGVYASSKRLPRKRATIDDLPAREELHGKMKKSEQSLNNTAHQWSIPSPQRRPHLPEHYQPVAVLGRGQAVVAEGEARTGAIDKVVGLLDGIQIGMMLQHVCLL